MLAFACAFTMFAGAAFTDQADINADNVDAVDLLTTLKIIKGYEDGSFDPDGVVTRAEMAKMIYTIRNDGNDDASAHVGNTTSFTDISGHWAEGYIKYLQNTGIVAGKSATKFDPDSQVTTVEAMKMALALTGYDEKNAGLTGIDWEKNTLSYATTIGLTDDVASAMRSGCARQDAAQILANCLGATAVRYSAVVENFVNDSKEGLSFGGDPISVGYKWMDLCTNIGTLVGIDGDKLTITMTQSDAADSDIETIKEFIDLDTDYSELLGQKVKVLFNDGKNNEVIGVYATVDNTVYTVEANDTSKDEEKVAFGGNSYRLDDKGGITTYIDGDKNAQWTSLDELDHNTLNPNMYTFVDTDDNGRLDTLVVRTYDVAKVSYVASDRVIAAGQTYKYDDEIIADGIEKDDWVVITHDMYNDCWNIEPVEVQSADLVGMRDDKNGDMYFDGNEKYIEDVNYDEYQVGDNWYNGGEAVQSNRSENDLKNVKAVQAVDYVAVNGIMFYVERSSGTNTGRVDNVAVVLATTTHNAVVDQARIAFFNGDTKVVNIEGKSENVVPGEAYEYDVINEEYRFSNLKAGIANAGNADWEDYEEYYGDLSFRGYDKDIDELNGDRFDNVKIDDNAQVLLYQVKDNGDWDVADITGKQFSNLNKAILMDNDDVYGFSGEMNGLNRIGAIALQVENNVDLSDIGVETWNHYGFIVSNVFWFDRNNGIAEYQMFSDGELYTVHEEIDDLSDRAKNTVLGFDELTADGDYYEIDGAVMLDENDGNLKFSAITKVSDDDETVIFANNGVEMDISDATIIYVDTKNGEGVVEGDVKVALKNYDLNGDPYMANALYIAAGTDVELLVVDQGTYLKSDEYKNLIDDNNVVYGEDKAPATDSGKQDYVEYEATVSRNGRLTVDFTADRPSYVPADASIKVEADVYADGVFVDTLQDTIPAGRDSVRNNTLTGYEQDEEIELRDMTLTPSKVNVRYVDENGNNVAGYLKDGYTKTLTTDSKNPETMGFAIDTNATNDVVGVKIAGTNNDKDTAELIGTDQAWGAGSVARYAIGDDYVTITLTGLDKLVESFTVKASAAATTGYTISDLTGGNAVNSTDGAKTVSITAPDATGLAYKTAPASVNVEISVGSALTKTMTFTLSDGNEIMVKAGATTATGTFNYSADTELSIVSVEEESTVPTVKSVVITDANGMTISSTTGYKNGDKIVITFSEKMVGDTTGTNLLEVVASTENGNNASHPNAGTAAWSNGGRTVTMSLTGAVLEVGDQLIIKGAASDATGNVIKNVTYVVKAAGENPELKA